MNDNIIIKKAMKRYSKTTPETTVTNDSLCIAFVQGAKYWEYRQTGATMWQTDQDICFQEAVERMKSGTLGEQLLVAKTQ